MLFRTTGRFALANQACRSRRKCARVAPHRAALRIDNFERSAPRLCLRPFGWALGSPSDPRSTPVPISVPHVKRGMDGEGMGRNNGRPVRVMPRCVKKRLCRGPSEAYWSINNTKKETEKNRARRNGVVGGVLHKANVQISANLETSVGVYLALSYIVAFNVRLFLSQFKNMHYIEHAILIPKNGIHIRTHR